MDLNNFKVMHGPCTCKSFQIKFDYKKQRGKGKKLKSRYNLESHGTFGGTLQKKVLH